MEGSTGEWWKNWTYSGIRLARQKGGYENWVHEGFFKKQKKHTVFSVWLHSHTPPSLSWPQSSFSVHILTFVLSEWRTKSWGFEGCVRYWGHACERDLF
jgi:hypothetical protein